MDALGYTFKETAAILSMFLFSALEEGASINPSKAGFSASVMISAGNLIGYGTVYLTEFLKENNNYNKACYAFLALLSVQFIANLFIEAKRSDFEDDSEYDDASDFGGEYDDTNLYNT
eukprot:g5088.t1